MSATALMTTTTLTEIADAIRAKTGSAAKISGGQMASQIMTINEHGVMTTLHITANGTYLPPTGYDGYSSVDADMSEWPDGDNRRF